MPSRSRFSSLIIIKKKQVLLLWLSKGNKTFWKCFVYCVAPIWKHLPKAKRKNDGKVCHYLTKRKKKRKRKKHIFRCRVRQVLYGGSAAFEQHHGPSLERKELREVNVAGGEHLFIALCNERPSTSTHLYTKHTKYKRLYCIYRERASAGWGWTIWLLLF
jgi:hypothetical protein